jgi:hypothetical protein
MAAIFLDLDGTVFEWGTENFLPGVVDTLRQWKRKGHQLIFTTQRDHTWAQRANYVLRDVLGSAPIVLIDVQNPRFLFNDQGATGITHPKNEAWPPEYAEI